MTAAFSRNWKENRRELVDSLYLFVLQGFNKLLPLFVLPYLMKVLGAGGYGYIGFSLAVVQCAILLIDFGFDLSATKRVALVRNDRRELTRVFWAVVTAKTVLLALSILIVGLLAFAIPSFRPYQAAILCTLPMAVGTAYTFMWMYQGIGKVRLMAVLNTISKCLLLPLIFIFIKSPDDVLLAAFIQSSVFVLTALLSCWWLWKLHVVGAPHLEWQLVRKETQDSLPLFLSRASTSVYTQLFVLILGIYCTQEAIGRYTSAEALMRALCFVIYIPLTQAFFPRISALGEADRPQAVRAFRQLRLIVAVAMLLVAALLFFGAPYVSQFFGDDYAGLETLLRIMSAAPLCIGLGAVYGQMGLIALGDAHTRRQFRNVYFIVAIAALSLVALLAPRWHETGAAMALLLSEMLVLVLMTHYYRQSGRHRKEVAPC